MSAGNGNGALPEGWEWRRLDEICEIRSGQAVPSSTYTDSEAGVPFLQGNAEFGELFPTPVKRTSAPRVFSEEGAVLISVRAPVGATNLSPGHVAIGRGLAALIPSDAVSARFLLWRLRADRQTLQGLATGTTFPAITSKILKAHRVLLPPRNKQEQLVSRITDVDARLDAGVTEVEQVRTRLVSYRKSLLSRATTGALVEGVTGSPAGTELLDSIKEERSPRMSGGRRRSSRKVPATRPAWTGRRLPKDWAVATWAEVGESQNGRAFPSADYCDEGVRLLRPGNLHVSGEVRWTASNTRHLPESYAEQHPQFLVGGGELVMNLTAQSLKDDFLGRICMTGAEERCLLNQRIARLTPILLNPHYVFLVFQSPLFRNYVRGMNKGSLIQHLFTSEVDQFLLPLPSRAEQDAIVEAVLWHQTRIADTEAAAVEATALAKSLHDSVAHRVLSGEISLI